MEQKNRLLQGHSSALVDRTLSSCMRILDFPRRELKLSLSSFSRLSYVGDGI